jgi:hypothetical protein
VWCLRALKVWAGDPSFEELRRRSGVPASTLADATNPGRAFPPRLETVRAFVTACGVTTGLARWEQAWRTVQHRRRTARAGTGAGHTDRPRQLPRAVRHFVGRRNLLAWVDTLGRTLGADDQWTPVINLTGPPGVGKTAAAVHWARRSATAYPDGQLYVDLGGSSGRSAVNVHDALASALSALGIGGSDLPTEHAARIGLYRSLTHSRRLLVLLDDAIGVEQVRPLLPTGPASLALVTSRNTLPALIAHEDAATLRVGPLAPTEAVQLLALLIGAERTGREPDAARELVGLCGCQPLAVRMAAARLIEVPRQPLTTYVRQLRSVAAVEDGDAGGEDGAGEPQRDQDLYPDRQLPAEPGDGRVQRFQRPR